MLKARSLRRKGISAERWDFNTFKDMKGTPWEPIPGRGERELKSNVNTHDAPIQRTQGQQDPTPDVRRVRINKEDMDRVGMTPGCAGCEALSRGATARGHNEECRRRVESDMKVRKHPAHERAEERMMTRLAEQLETNDTDKEESQGHGGESEHVDAAREVEERMVRGDKRKAEEDIE